MPRTATTEQAARDLQAIIDSWPHLTDMLTTRHGTTWPPAGRMTDQLRADEQADAPTWEEELAARALARIAERADSRYTLGESPAPIRLAIVDVIRTIETDLVYLADVLAQEVQRPVMRAAPDHWLPEDRERRDKLRTEDASDPRRWRYRQNRTAPHAAAWLLGRVEGRPGPFLPLGPTHVRRITAVAGAAHAHIRRALDGDRIAQVVDRPCPLCGGVLGIASGDGQAPIVACFGCRQEWRLPASAEAA